MLRIGGTRIEQKLRSSLAHFAIYLLLWLLQGHSAQRSREASLGSRRAVSRHLLSCLLDLHICVAPAARRSRRCRVAAPVSIKRRQRRLGDSSVVRCRCGRRMDTPLGCAGAVLLFHSSLGCAKRPGSGASACGTRPGATALRWGPRTRRCLRHGGHDVVHALPAAAGCPAGCTLRTAEVHLKLRLYQC